MTQQMESMFNSWNAALVLAQTAPAAGAAPQTTAPASQPAAPSGTEPVAVGVPTTGGATQSIAPGGSTGSPAVGPGAKGTAPNMDFMWIMMVLLVVMVVMTSLTGRKERKKRQEIMASMKKQDKVLTTGGVIGVIVEMTDDEVVLRVEEGRIRFSRSAIQTVLRSGTEKPAIAGAA